ncbi:hypothetical protein D0Z00_003847 [Geotrichum galactomycetum]|uniref:Uncharacterized protein n=1 Tax=Geotrichum galactomycetum TaxID=27317 RepID=A0ACB6V013_9ASCO|nr:hypothetical protein D0Z00_003847 [Geotrichum candidum]
MNGDSSSSKIVLPAIDTSDLISFHLAHFQGTYPLGMERLNVKAANNPEVELSENRSDDNYSEHDDYYDDGLGYYPDGTKRTLTDEQIAFLRASELRQIQQQQQAKK